MTMDDYTLGYTAALTWPCTTGRAEEGILGLIATLKVPSRRESEGETTRMDRKDENNLYFG